MNTVQLRVDHILLYVSSFSTLYTALFPLVPVHDVFISLPHAHFLPLHLSLCLITYCPTFLPCRPLLSNICTSRTNADYSLLFHSLWVPHPHISKAASAKSNNPRAFGPLLYTASMLFRYCIHIIITYSSIYSSTRSIPAPIHLPLSQADSAMTFVHLLQH